VDFNSKTELLNVDCFSLPYYPQSCVMQLKISICLSYYEFVWDNADEDSFWLMTFFQLQIHYIWGSLRHWF